MPDDRREGRGESAPLDVEIGRAESGGKGQLSFTAGVAGAADGAGGSPAGCNLDENLVGLRLVELRSMNQLPREGSPGELTSTSWRTKGASCAAIT